MHRSAEIPVEHEVLSAGLSKHPAATRGNGRIETDICAACAHPLGRERAPDGAVSPWRHLIESSSQSGHAPVPSTTTTDDKD